MNKALPLALVVVLAGVLAWLLLGWEPAPDEPDPHRVLDLNRPPEGGDFTLQSAAGPVSLADLRGKVVLIYFGYTWCPDICPINLSYLTLALDALGEDERAQVKVLFVSVDPQRDTPQRLGGYTRHFAPDILGLTGTPDQVARAAAAYGAAYRRAEGSDSAMGYAIDHSAYTYLVDRSGRLRESLEHATPPERVVAAIRSLLSDGETP